MNKIDVRLYGGKSLFSEKETPLEAEILYCDHCSDCDLYKQGRCLNGREPFARAPQKCVYGKVETVHGYTSGAKKYAKFRDQYLNDPVYNRLIKPRNIYYAEIGDYIFLQLIYIAIDSETKEIRCGCEKKSTYSFVRKNECTAELICKALSQTPRTTFGNNEITEYQADIVPNVITDIRKKNKKLYNDIIKLNPQFDGVLNYVGRRAYIKTLANGCKIKNYDGNEYTFLDGVLVCDNYKASSGYFRHSKAKVKIEVGDDAMCAITDNAQCDDNTVFG